MKLTHLRTVLVLSAFAALSAEAQVVINEINYDPSDPTKVEQFIELHNPTGSAVSIAGWKLEDGVDFTFPAGTTIPANGYRVVAQSTAVFQARFGFTPLGPWVGTLKKSGERIQLKNSSAVVVDQLTYGSGFPWPTSPRGNGNTMELIHPSLDNDLGGSWRGSVPGLQTTIIAKGSSGWRYRETRSDPPTTWKELGFDDSSAGATEWLACTMPAGFALSAQFAPAVTFNTVPGYGGNTADKTRTYYFRKKFNIVDPAAISGVTVNIRRDDAAVIWINNDTQATALSADGAFVPPYTYAGLGPNATNVATYVSHTIPSSKLVAGDNILAIELHQSSAGSSDLLIDAEVILPATSGSPGAQNSVFAAVAPPQIRQVENTPLQPVANVPVLITARITDPQGVASVTLGYQLVEPGAYIRRTDAAYNTTWTNVTMVDDGTGGDVLASDGIFSYTMPQALQTHRRLVRYRITATDTGAASITVPYADDEQPNFAYFVYTAIPSYTGVVQAGAVAPRGTSKTFPASTLDRLPPYQFITDATDHDNCLYVSANNGVRYYATLVYEGKVYDHIQYHNRGIGSTYVSGKNKFALFFNKARDIRIRDNWGKYFDEDWNSMPVDACASPWAAVHRGMAGVEEAVAYRLYELAGMSSLRTTYLQWRVIRSANENGTGQYDTDLWGLYMALEPTESNFLGERNLADGNIYAIEGAAGDKKHQAVTQVTTAADWTTYRDAAVVANQTEAWYRANMDTNAFYTFFALNRFVGNVDVRPGDNYRYYHRSTDDRWVIIPYDLDMMSMPAHHWGGTLADTFVWAGAPSQSVVLARHTALAIEFRNRCREMLSLVGSDNSVSGGQIGQLVDEYAQMVSPTGAPFTIANLDETIWSNHPRTQGGGANNGQTSHKNNFYRATFFDTRGGLGGTPATNWTRTFPDPDGDGYGTFQDSMNYLTNFMTNTWPGGTWLRANGNPVGYGYQHLLWESIYGGWGNVNANPTVADLAFPNPPTITYTGPVGFPANALDFSSSTFSPATAGNGGTTFAAMQWRIGEISAPGIPGYVAGTKRTYEVEQVWTSPEIATFNSAQRIPLANAEPGKTYRARVRHKDANGRWSVWSAPVQFVVGTPDVSVYAASLVVSELNYNPAPVTPAEFAAGYSSDSFEWVEVKNISASPVDMTGVRFTKGIDFDFPNGWTIPAGGYALVVRDLAAFQSRWGMGFNAIIAGATLDNFSNGGEEVKLSYGVGTEIFRFVYDDIAPWPVGIGAGRTIVMKTPAPIAFANQTNGTLWRASYALGGSPGADDVLTFDIWNDDYPGVTSLTADDDADGFVNLLEYAFGTSPLAASAGPVRSTGSYTVLGVPGTYLVLTVTHRVNGSDINTEVQFTTSLTSTWLANGVLEASVTNGDGTVTETWRAPSSLAEQSQQYARVRVTKP